jgi:hypothetical protein
VVPELVVNTPMTSERSPSLRVSSRPGFEPGPLSVRGLVPDCNRRSRASLLNAVSFVAIHCEGFGGVLRWRISIHLPAKIAATANRAAAPALSQAVP